MCSIRLSIINQNISEIRAILTTNDIQTHSAHKLLLDGAVTAAGRSGLLLEVAAAWGIRSSAREADIITAEAAAAAPC
jgi:hypothetical protein